MAYVADRRRIGLGLLDALSTALLVWFGTGLDPAWPLTWFAPLPVLLFAGRASWWGAGLTAASGWLLGNLNMWHYYYAVIDIPPAMVVLILLTLTLIFALAVMLYGALLRRRAYWSALLVLPAFWVSFEYLLNLASPHGTGGDIAYSQLKFLAFLQLASITGPWGMSFVLLLFPAALSIGLLLRVSAPKQARRIVGASVAAILAVLAFGLVRLTLPDRGKSVKVGLIASDAPTSPPMADEGAAATELFQSYATQATKLAAQGAQVIVLPEKLGVAADPDTQNMDSLFQSLADTTRADTVVGLIRVAAPVAYNEARVYAPDAPVLTYDKHHMLPAFESNLHPGSTLTLMSTASGIWGVAICKDMDFTALSRQYGHAGVGLMLVPAWDFDLDRIWHGHLALMRGVESGFSIVRAAKQGYLTVSDDRGRILAETTSDSAPFATLLAQVPVVHDGTFYVLFGDWFAWVTLGLFAMTLAQCVRRTSA